MRGSVVLLFLVSATALGVLVEADAKPHRRGNGYGVSGGDWMNRPSKKQHHKAAAASTWAPPPPPAPAQERAAMADPLPIHRARGGGYSMPMAQRDSHDRRLTEDNTPIAKSLGRAGAGGGEWCSCRCWCW
jgi:hypothetical protein